MKMEETVLFKEPKPKSSTFLLQSSKFLQGIFEISI